MKLSKRGKNSYNLFIAYIGAADGPETLPETIESGPLCITDLFQNKYVAYLLFLIIFYNYLYIFLM